MTKRGLAIILIVFMGLVGWLGLSWLNMAKGVRTTSHPTADITDPNFKIGGAFRLKDQYGHRVDQTLLKGHWSLVFFGYTFCPNVCPLTLQSLNQAEAQMGDKAKALQIVFISVDPERDTPAALKAYVDSNGFPRGINALTGTSAEIAAAAKAWRVQYQKQGSGPGYTMDHTATVFVKNPKGEFVAPIGFGLPPAKTADLLTLLMAESDEQIKP